MKNTILVLSAAAAVTLLGGCASTTHFTSEPTGATVSYEGKTIGVTPFDYVTHDRWGWFSNYVFTVTKDGYKEKQVKFHESHITDAAEEVVPKSVNVVLDKN